MILKIIKIKDKIAHWDNLAKTFLFLINFEGEFYPCKPDIFEATYEPVND